MVSIELAPVQIEHVANLVRDATPSSPQWKVLRKQHHIPYDLRRPLGRVVDNAEAVQDLVAVLALEQKVHLAEDDHQRVIDLVGDTPRQFGHGREPLRSHHFRLRVTQVLELLSRLAIETRVVERQPDLVGCALEQGDLFVGKRVGVSASERERAKARGTVRGMRTQSQQVQCQADWNTVSLRD